MTVAVWLERQAGRPSAAFAQRALERYLGEPAVIARTGAGKPFLRGFHDVDFSLSHSGRLIALAVTRGARVGIDIELIRPQLRAGAIARRFFSPAEADALGALDTADRTLAFYCRWTAKEAYLKAIGTGLAMPMSSFDLDELDGWDIAELELPPGYAGAVAIERQPCSSGAIVKPASFSSSQ